MKININKTMTDRIKETTSNKSIRIYLNKMLSYIHLLKIIIKNQIKIIDIIKIRNR
jgi:hypothetical protein